MVQYRTCISNTNLISYVNNNKKKHGNKIYRRKVNIFAFLFHLNKTERERGCYHHRNGTKNCLRFYFQKNEYINILHSSLVDSFFVFFQELFVIFIFLIIITPTTNVSTTRVYTKYFYIFHSFDIDYQDIRSINNIQIFMLSICN